MKRRCAGCTAVIDGRPNKLYCSVACRKSAENERGYLRRKHPEKVREVPALVRSFIGGSNGVLIERVARLGFLGGPESTVLDTTYGRGGFWTLYRPAHLVRTVADFRQLPHPDGSVEVVVYDPPYISTGSRATSTVDDFYDRFGLGDVKGWRALRQLIDAGLAECARVLAPGGYLLVKCMDYTESGRKVWNTFHVYAEAERLGLVLVDRFHHVTGGGPQPADNLDGTPREQKGAREVASMLLVLSRRRTT